MVAEIWKELLLPEVKDEEEKEKKEENRHPIRRRREAQLRVLKELELHHIDLLSGKEGVVLGRDEVAALAEKLRKALPSYQYKQAVQYLARGLEKGARTLGWRAAMPPIPVAFPHEPAPFAPRDFRGLIRLRKFESLFLKGLELPPPSLPDVRLGQLLFSAIVYGGLLAGTCLSPWCEALRNGNVRLEREGLWIEMEAEVFSGPVMWDKARAELNRQTARDGREVPVDDGAEARPMVKRRWFADPLTEVLVLRWLADAPTAPLLFKTDTLPWHCLGAFLQTLEAGRAGAFATTRSFLAWAATRTRLVAPAFLVEYAMCRMASVSLPASTWARLRLGKAVPVKGKPKTGEPAYTHRSSLADIRHGNFDLDRQPDLLREVLHILRPPGDQARRSPEKCRNGLRGFLEANGAALSPLLYCMVAWAIDLLTKPSLGARSLFRVKRLEPSSVRRYFAAIAWPLLGMASIGDISSLSADELEELYRDIIESKRALRDRTYTADRLVGFHAFLNAVFSVPAINYAEIRGGGMQSEHGVDANLVSARDFRNLLQVIGGDEDGRSRIREIRAIVAILGFHCGLRRQEALTLRVGDVMGDSNPDIVVRSNRFARVKSIASHRIIPLRPLMPENHVARIRKWVRRRVAEDGDRYPENFLFCALGNAKMPLLAADIFDPITEALHQVTGDVTLRFHHLRHSFATWLLLRLIGRAAPGLADEFSTRSYSRDKGLMAPARRIALMGATTGRRFLYVTSLLSGHAGPSTTALHYLHLCDWALARALSDPAAQPRLSELAIKRLTAPSDADISASAAPKGDKGKLIAPFLSTIRHDVVLTLSEPIDKTGYWPSLKRLPEPPSKLPSWRLVGMILERIENGKTSVALEAAHGVPAAEISAWGERASRISQIKTRRGEFRHADESGKLISGKRLLYADQDLVDRIFIHVNTLAPASRMSLPRGIGVFLNGYSVGAGDVRFGDLVSARAYCRFLGRLGISPGEISLVHYPKEGQTDDEQRSHRQQWARDLGLSFERSRPRGKGVGNEVTIGARGWVGLQVVPDPANSKNRSQQKHGRDHMASPGLRYAIYLLAVLLGAENLPGSAA